jgi:hypothetical protein
MIFYAGPRPRMHEKGYLEIYGEMSGVEPIGRFSYGVSLRLFRTFSRR